LKLLDEEVPPAVFQKWCQTDHAKQLVEPHYVQEDPTWYVFQFPPIGDFNRSEYLTV
jgi:hypothetical protein